MISDNAKISDKLGFAKYIQILSNLILNTEELPFTIGIFGEWGTGKTSLMKSLEYFLRKKGQGKIKTIWFNPWKYDEKEIIWNAFIQTILSEIRLNVENSKRKKKEELKQKISGFASKMAWYAAEIGLPKLTAGIVDKDIIEKFKNAFGDKDGSKDIYHFINKFEIGFSEAIKDYVGSRGKLIVFVDDLDRCVPENAIMVLESLKLFLDNSRCVFILGLDKRIVEQGITMRYKGQISINGKDYLDKIIQLPFELPKRDFSECKSFFSSYKTLTSGYNDDIWKLIEMGTLGNPRKIVRFINTFYITKFIYKLDNTTNSIFSETTIAKLLIIQLQYPGFFDILKKFPDSFQNYESLFETEIQEGPVAVKKIVTNKYPYLDIFWDDSDLKNFIKGTQELGKCNDPEEIEKFMALSSP